MRLTANFEISKEEANLFELQDAHTLWNNPLLVACREGRLTVEDFQFLFGQYFAYSRSFTRYLAALMVNVEDDLHRAKLIANLWEEGGGTTPERRHSNLFRIFLRDGLGLSPEYIRFEVPTLRFVTEYLDSSGSRDIPFATAFLAIGARAQEEDRLRVLTKIKIMSRRNWIFQLKRLLQGLANEVGQELFQLRPDRQDLLVKSKEKVEREETLQGASLKDHFRHG